MMMFLFAEGNSKKKIKSFSANLNHMSEAATSCRVFHGCCC